MVQPKPIGSKHPELKRLRKLIRQAKARSQERAFVVDGPTLVAEALASPLLVHQVFIGVDNRGPVIEPEHLVPGVSSTGPVAHRPSVHLVDGEVLRSVLDPVSPRPVAAVVETPIWSEDSIPADRPVMIAVELRDPGNLGTVVRTAEAAGFGGVVVTDNSVDITNPKVVRASAGSMLRLPVPARRPLVDVVARLGADGHRVVAAVIDGDAPPYDEIDLTTAAIMIGNEPRGLSPDQTAMADLRMTIPMAGPAESLNVGAAAAVLAFEAARQRRHRRAERSHNRQGGPGG